MQTITGANNVYSPGPIPDDISLLPSYLNTELLAIQGVMNYLAQGHLDKVYASPLKPRDGDIRYADGTTWNPGSGAGVYYYNGTIWKLLG